MSTFIVEKSKLLPVYYQYLKEKVLFKPSTIIDVNENVQVLVHWFCVYRTQTSYSTDSSLLYNVNLIIKTMRKVFNKQRHVEEAKNTGMNFKEFLWRFLLCFLVYLYSLFCASSFLTDNSIEGLVSARKWPVGGLQELCDAVRKKMSWAKDLCISAYVPCVSIFNQFMQLFMAAIFACNTNLACIL